jgi:hypothetical protein
MAKSKSKSTTKAPARKAPKPAGMKANRDREAAASMDRVRKMRATAANPETSTSSSSIAPAMEGTGVVIPADVAVLAARMAHKGKTDQPMTRVSVEDGRVVATDGIRLVVVSELDSRGTEESLFPDRGHIALVPAEDLLEAAHGKKVGHVRVASGANEVHTLAMNGKRRRTTRFESLQGSKTDFPDWRPMMPGGRGVAFRADSKKLGIALQQLARAGCKHVAFHLGTIEQPLLLRGETDGGRQVDLVVAPIVRDGDKLQTVAFGGDLTPVADPAKAARSPDQGELGKKPRRSRKAA